jgi:hypothetical protein
MTEPIRGAGQPSWPLSPYQIAVSYGIPGAAGATGAPNATAAAAAGIITRGGGADWFGPLDPLKPIAPPEVAGRRFDFPPGYNLVTRPRAYEPIGFAELRGFADAYDLLRLVIETRKDQMERQRWCIRPRAPLPSLARTTLPRLRGRAGWGAVPDSAAAPGLKRAATTADTSARIAALEKFWHKPDGVTRWKTWLRALLEDMFVIDAATLYCRRTRAGQLCALHQLDGATIKRVIDDWGRTPQPYAAPDGSTIYPPAYQQVLKGLPAVDYAVRDIIYRPRNVRAHRVYGYSPVQQVLMTVNIALRRQLWQLDYFSEGSIPDALIGVPAGWTPDQIRQFQDYWDTEFAGDLAKRRRAKFVPGESAVRVHQTKEAGAQAGLRRVARAHHLLRVFGAAAMGGQADEPRHRRQPVGAGRGRGFGADQGVGQGPRRRGDRRRVCLARPGTDVARRGFRRRRDRGAIRSAGQDRRRDAQRTARRARPRPVPKSRRRPPDGAHRHRLRADRGGWGWERQSVTRHTDGKRPVDRRCAVRLSESGG